MSSSGTIRAMTPLLPWRPAILSHGKLTLHGDINFYQLDDAGRKFVALLELLLALVGDLPEDVDLPGSHLLDFVDLLDEQRILIGKTKPLEVARGNLLDNVPGKRRALGEQPLIGLFVVQVGHELLI